MVKVFANEQCRRNPSSRSQSTVSIDEQVSRRWPLDDFVSTGENQFDSLVNLRDIYVTVDEILRVCTCVLLSCDHRCEPSREYVKAVLTTIFSQTNRGLHKLFCPQ